MVKMVAENHWLKLIVSQKSEFHLVSRNQAVPSLGELAQPPAVRTLDQRLALFQTSQVARRQR